MDAGGIDRLISITKTTSTSRSDDGAPILTVSTLSSNVWARVRPLTGREPYIDNALFFEADTEFTIRYTTLISEQCRIIYESDSYDVKKIIDFAARHIELHIVGQRVR